MLTSQYLEQRELLHRTTASPGEIHALEAAESFHAQTHSHSKNSVYLRIMQVSLSSSWSSAAT